jgi:hypothetical protein
MKGVELEISILSEDEFSLQELDIEIENDLSNWEKRTFWSVGYAYVSLENKNFTAFSSGEEVFLCNMNYKDFVKLINNSNID